jgi:hypothetical protein
MAEPVHPRLLKLVEERDALKKELMRARMSAAKWKHLAEKAQRTTDAKPKAQPRP